MKSILAQVTLDELKLDINNPRFAELYSGSENEDELIEYLLYSESAEEVAKGIVRAGEYYPDRPLWVLKNDNHYLVKDGNRRCAAVKALNHPSKFGLNESKKIISELPVLIYYNKEDLEARILQEHTNSLFREWDRIAKALEVYKMYTTGNSIDSMKEIDSQPAQLIKLASFYYQSVKIGGDNLKKLLRRGRGKSGGKTIIFERLFSFSKLCGYSFRNKPSYKIVLNDKSQFEKYIIALIQYLTENPGIRTEDVDKEKEAFLKRLEPYGFIIPKTNNTQAPLKQTTSKDLLAPSQNESITSDTNQTLKEEQTSGNNPTNTNVTQSESNNAATTSKNDSQTQNETNNPTNKKSVKTRPIYNRKKIPPTLDKLIKECYTLDAHFFPNAKTALTRVTFECTLKYVVENTIYTEKKNLSESNYFRNVFYDKGIKRQYTDFTKLKGLFTELISSTGLRKAFENFDIERTHQIIHNYHVGATYSDATGLCDNLIPLIEFMLQEEEALINSIDKTKL